MPDSDDMSQMITNRLDEVLQEVDLDVTSQKQIVNKLAEELGEDVREHKALIKVQVADWRLLTPLCTCVLSSPAVQSKIDEFLKLPQATENDSDPKDINAGERPDPPNKKRKHEPDAPVSAKASKVAPWEVGELEVDLTGSRKIVVSKFKGKLYVSTNLHLYVFTSSCHN